MNRLCKLFGHAYRQEHRKSTHWASNTVHNETWNVCKRKRCDFEHKVATDKVRHAEDVMRGRS